MHLLGLCCLLAVGVAGQRCKDRDFTGFDLMGAPAKCAALIEHCKDEVVGNEIKVLCPETCGTCVRSGKDVTADDVYVEFTKLIVENNNAIQAAEDAKMAMAAATSKGAHSTVMPAMPGTGDVPPDAPSLAGGEPPFPPGDEPAAHDHDQDPPQAQVEPDDTNWIKREQNRKAAVQGTLYDGNQVDDFYASMNSYGGWMLSSCTAVARAAAMQGDWKKVRLYLDAALKAYKQSKEIVYIQAGIPGPVQYSGWEDDKHVKELVKLVGAVAFQKEIEAGLYVEKKRPTAAAIEEQLSGLGAAIKAQLSGLDGLGSHGGSGTPALGAAQPAQLAQGGYSVLPYQRKLLDQLPPPLPSVGVDWVPASITSDELRDQYFLKGRPVVIGPGLLDDWPAMQRWTKSSLLQQYAGVMLNASNMPKPQYAVKPADKLIGADDPNSYEDISHIWEGEPFFFTHRADISPKVTAAGYPNATFIELDYTLHDDGSFTVNHDDLTGLVPIAFYTSTTFNANKLVGKVAEKGATLLTTADFMMGAPPDHVMEDGFMAEIPVLNLDRVFAKKAQKLLQIDKQKSLTFTVTVKRKAAQKPPQTAAEAENSRYDLPAEQIPMVQYINTVMSGHEGNLSHPEGRYIFNTFGKDVQPGTTEGTPHPMWKDVVWPALIRNASEGVYRDEPHGADTSFEFFFGPALSGAYPHVHGAAWNGCLYGRKRWIITTAEKWEIVHNNNANMPINVWFKEKYQAINEQHPGIFWEFIQEPGEVVFIPAGWGHGIINIEPTIGISMQMGMPHGPMPPVVQAFMEKSD